jgi:hypothetical protein
MNLCRWRKRATERFVGDHYLVNLIALRALKRAEVETQTRGHDASEHHMSAALWANRAFNLNVDTVRQGMRFWHNASLN